MVRALVQLSHTPKKVRKAATNVSVLPTPFYSEIEEVSNSRYHTVDADDIGLILL